MKINEMSEKFNISLTKLRYYEKVGLIDNVKRVNNIREYEEKDIERLKMVLALKESGLSIKEILTYINLEKAKDKTDEKKDIFIKRRYKIIDRIHELEDNLKSIDYFIYKLDHHRMRVG